MPRCARRSPLTRALPTWTPPSTPSRRCCSSTTRRPKRTPAERPGGPGSLSSAVLAHARSGERRQRGSGAGAPDVVAALADLWWDDPDPHQQREGPAAEADPEGGLQD